MTLAVTHCPECRKKMKTMDSREHTAYGFQTVRRRRGCLYCSFRITTVELPLNIGNSVFEEDE